MNKTELISAVAEKSSITKKDADKIVSSVFDVIGDALKSGDKVQLVGFGTFEVKERAARKGLNPLTKQPIDIAASKAPVFKAGKGLKDLIK
jgi:DNA-binding protein HU-beta